MADRVPSFFMLVPGPWRDSRELVRTLSEHGVLAKHSDGTRVGAGEVRVEIVENERMAEGFSWGRRGRLAEDLIASVGACKSAALVECGHRLNDDPGRVAKLGRALRDSGGVAVRMEASGAASAWQPWLAALESGSSLDLYEGAVLVVEGEDGEVFTCGMQQFDLPDAQVLMSDPADAIAWLDTFCVYQLDEQPVLASGHTFQPHLETPRRTFERWPDHRHELSDGRHNRFGLWRFLQPGTAGIQPTKSALVFIPSLSALLTAAESSQGRALTRVEVGELVSAGAVIAMTQADALALERSRGYADIEPELAWEQWQIVRLAST
jgi:hypothetical protein